MKGVKQIRETFASLRPDEKGMLEIQFAQFEADEPAIFGTPNQDWHARELEWYMSMSRYVQDIPPPVPTIWQKVASKTGMINSNYGWCIFSEENGSQYKMALEALLADPYTRQAVMIYTRPSMHSEFRLDGTGYDFICTNTTQALIRDGVLDYSVNMRSSDAVLGYKGDLAWHTFVRDMLADDLTSRGIMAKRGKIVWNATSFHIYPQHRQLVTKYWETGEA